MGARVVEAWNADSSKRQPSNGHLDDLEQVAGLQEREDRAAACGGEPGTYFVVVAERPPGGGWSGDRVLLWHVLEKVSAGDK